MGWVAWEGWVVNDLCRDHPKWWFSIGQNCPLIQIGIRVICLDLILYFAVFLIELSYIVCLLQLVMETGQEFFLVQDRLEAARVCIYISYIRTYVLYTFYIYLFIYTYVYQQNHIEESTGEKKTKRNLPKVFQTPKTTGNKKDIHKNLFVFLINPSFLTRIHVMFSLYIPVFLWNPCVLSFKSQCFLVVASISGVKEYVPAILVGISQHNHHS